jgi:hypothetical protein
MDATSKQDVLKIVMHLKDVAVTEVSNTEPSSRFVEHTAQVDKVLGYPVNVPTVTIDPNDVIEHVTLQGDGYINTTVDIKDTIEQVRFNRAKGRDSFQHINGTKKALLSYVSVFNIVGI